MKKMMIVAVVAVVLVATVFVGCKYIRGQIVDGPGMERDTTDLAMEEPVDGLAGKDSVKVDLLDIDEMPKTAVRQQNAHFQYAVYINVDKPASGEGEMDAVKSVWLANERTGTVIKVCVTNPMAEAQWSKMSGEAADGVSVALTQIAAADNAMIAPGDVSKVIVEGCPDGRNVWTYIIDPYQGTAIQLPSAEGVVSLDWGKKEIIAASYGYNDNGRYSVNKAYSLDGKFLHKVGEEDAIEAQIRKMYDRLNDMDKNGVINIVTLENEFCSSYYLSLRNAIHKAIKDATGEDRMFFGDDEGYRFLAGMPTPLEVESIKAELLTGDMAQAQVRFKGADKKNGFMRLELDLEDGVWRVKNFDQKEAFGPGGILKIMEDFAREHGIKY